MDRSILDHINGSSLYYPCSGADFWIPVFLFAPFVREFWFVDKAYFQKGWGLQRHRGLPETAQAPQPALMGKRGFGFLGARVEGPPENQGSGSEIAPCVRIETYRHVKTGCLIELKFRRGYGRSAFRKEVRQIGVFFYRRDSLGEGGSGDLWMTRDSVDTICERLIEGGLIVTDGSNAGWPHRRYPEMTEFSGQHGMCSKETVKVARTFVTRSGCRLWCVGYAGRGYGPTLIWQVLGGRRGRGEQKSE